MISCIEVLLESAGVDVNAAEGDTGDTALHMAVEFGSKVVVQLLLDSDADTEASNAEGKTPLGLALDAGESGAALARLIASQNGD